MSIFELQSKILTTYKADTSDLRAKLREVAGDEKKLAEQRLANAEAENKRIEKQIESYHRIRIGMEALQLAGVNVGEEFKKLTGLSGGLASAGFAVGGAWGAGIGLAGEAVGKLLDSWLDADKRLKKSLYDDYAARMELFDSLEETGQKARDEYLAQVKAADDANAAIGGVNRALHEHIDSWQKAKDAVTSYALALAQVQSDRGGGFVDRQEIELARKLRDAKLAQAGVSAQYGSVAADARIKSLHQTDSVIDIQKAWADRANNGMTYKEYQDALAAAGVKSGPGKVSDYIGGRSTDYDFGGGSLSTSLGAKALSVDKYGNEILPDTQGPYQAMLASNTKSWNERLAAQQGKKQSFLEGAFGKIDEFNAYSQAFQALSGAVGAALTAWIDGSQSAGQAFKKFIGEAVKGLAVQMAMEALKHGAYAIGSLAFGDVRGAATHGAAAAEFAAGAVAAAAAAKALGGGGGGASTGARGGASGGAPGYSGGGAGGGSQGTAVTIVYGDSFADDSPRARQLKARKMVNTALGTSAVEYR